MNDPYKTPEAESPKPTAKESANTLRLTHRLTQFCIAGAFVGYFLFQFLATLEIPRFKSIKNLVNGQSSMAELEELCANNWVDFCVFFGLVLTGLSVGFLSEKLIYRSSNPKF